MDKKAIFYKVKRHLLAQGGPAMDGREKMCMYRTEDGRKCAIGCLIPDEAYRKEWEGKCLTIIISDYPSILGILGIEDRSIDIIFLRSLQDAHDDFMECGYPASWEDYIEQKFESLEKHYGISHAP